MGEQIKKDLLTRLTHLPTTTLGFIIIILGLGLVFLGKIDMDHFIGFMVVSMPFFFYRKEQPKKEDKE